MNDNADDSVFPERRCSLMLGVAAHSPGVATEALRKKRLADLPDTVATDLTFPYSGATAADDRILVVRGGALYRALLTATPSLIIGDALNVSLGTLIPVTNSSGVSFAVGKRVRAVQFQDEVFFVQEGGLTLLRYNGTALYKAGVATPNAPTDGGNIAGVMTVGATVKYAITYADEKGRESSPSTYLSIVVGAGGGRTINWTAPTDLQVTRVYLYKTAANGSLLYRVVQAGFTIATTTYADATVTDANLVLNTGAPLPFQNDPPLAASLIAVYNKNRLALNETADRFALQLSNENMPTQFPPIGDPDFPTDGSNFQVVDALGGEITAIGGMGSALVVWTRSNYGLLFGSEPAEFSFKMMGDKGCIAPDSVAQGNNVAVFMSENGVYALLFEQGFITKKISDDLDGQFKAVAVEWFKPTVGTLYYTREQRGAKAIGKIMQDKYYLAVPPFMCIYDMNTGGWSLDYLIGMEYPPPSLDLLNGYSTMDVVQAGRTYDILVIGLGLPVFAGDFGGDIWASSVYPLEVPFGSDLWQFEYEDRAIDGAGSARSTVKRLRRTRVFGDFSPALGPNKQPAGAEPLLFGDIFAYVDGEEVEHHQIVALTPADKRAGLLFFQEWSPKVTGRVITVRIKATCRGRILLRDRFHQYSRLSG